MSPQTEQVIDIVVSESDFTKLNDTQMRWDGSVSTTISGANPTLLIGGLLADTEFQVISVGEILTLAE